MRKLVKTNTPINFKPIGKKVINQEGKKFGRLLVQKYLGLNYKRHSVYECLCDCGNICNASGPQLMKYRVNSCGCYTIEIHKKHHKANGLKNRKDPIQVALNHIYNTYIANAKSRNYEFTLTKDQTKALILSNCFYCNVQPSNTKTNKDTGFELKYNGIDRKNNNIGYIPENVVSCCKRCNYLKSDTNIEDFLNHIKQIYEFTEKVVDN
jgi:hypothetical protein